MAGLFGGPKRGLPFGGGLFGGLVDGGGGGCGIFGTVAFRCDEVGITMCFCFAVLAMLCALDLVSVFLFAIYRSVIGMSALLSTCMILVSLPYLCNIIGNNIICLI